MLGEEWLSHHGDHDEESTRGIVPKHATDHPITNGVGQKAIWGPTDVYEAYPPEQATVLLKGQVLSGMKPDSKPNDEKNDPMMPIAWLNPYQLPDGNEGMAFTTTIGDARDFSNTALRRMFVNAVYYLLDLSVPDRASVNTVGTYNPSKFGYGDHRKGMFPSDHKLDK